MCEILFDSRSYTKELRVKARAQQVLVWEGLAGTGLARKAWVSGWEKQAKLAKLAKTGRTDK